MGERNERTSGEMRKKCARMEREGEREREGRERDREIEAENGLKAKGPRELGAEGTGCEDPIPGSAGGRVCWQQRRLFPLHPLISLLPDVQIRCQCQRSP